MESNISLEKDKIKLKGQGAKIIIPLDPKEGGLWEELDDSEARVRKLYKVMQSNLDMVEPNNQGELDLGLLTFVGCNYNSNLYDWEPKNYEHMQKNARLLRPYQNIR